MTYATYHGHQARDVAREAVSAFASSTHFPAGTAQERIPEFGGQSLFAPIWSVTDRTKKRQVSKPIKVHIYFEGDVFFAENETLVVVGTGSSPTEAIDDLGRHIIHFYQYYKRLSWDKVTGDALRLKKIYETLFIETR
ncbi:MAG: hypothetical protein M0Z67_11135 [Nitrospiraceae bacterium]|nr:hypothetical protein [Nitrospiraceae bacterium]